MAKAARHKKKPTIRFEAVKIEPLFKVLDAVAWMVSPGVNEIAQYADIDPRTAGKLVATASPSMPWVCQLCPAKSPRHKPGAVATRYGGQIHREWGDRFLGRTADLTTGGSRYQAASGTCPLTPITYHLSPNPLPYPGRRLARRR